MGDVPTRYTVTRNENGLGFSNGITRSKSGELVHFDEYCALRARIEDLEGLVAYLAGTNGDHVRCALAGNPSVIEEIYRRARAALQEPVKED